MNFDPTDILVIVLLVVLGISVLVAIVVIAKTFANDAKEAKAKAAKLEKEEKRIPHEPQIASQAPAKSKAKAKPKPKAKAKPAPAKTHKDDVSDDDDLVAAAEVYLTYELKEQAIITLSKHLLKHPNDKKALALLKKAEASK